MLISIRLLYRVLKWFFTSQVVKPLTNRKKKFTQWVFENSWFTSWPTYKYRVLHHKLKKHVNYVKDTGRIFFSNEVCHFRSIGCLTIFWARFKWVCSVIHNTRSNLSNLSIFRSSIHKWKRNSWNDRKPTIFPIFSSDPKLHFFLVNIFVMFHEITWM